MGKCSNGSPPRAGFSDGVHDYELPGSGVEGAFMDTNTVSGLIYHNLNSSVPGSIFLFRNGEPSDLCLEPAPRTDQPVGKRQSAPASTMSRV